MPTTETQTTKRTANPMIVYLAALTLLGSITCWSHVASSSGVIGTLWALASGLCATTTIRFVLTAARQQQVQ